MVIAFLRLPLAAISLAAAVIPNLGLAQSPPPAPLGGAMITGEVTGLVGAEMQLRDRRGRIIAVNLRVARAHDLVPRLYLGEFVQVQGRLTGSASLTAASIMRAKSAAAAWPADTP